MSHNRLIETRSSLLVTLITVRVVSINEFIKPHNVPLTSKTCKHLRQNKAYVTF